jgi:CRP-like cAMP-binding protein
MPSLALPDERLVPDISRPICRATFYEDIALGEKELGQAFRSSASQVQQAGAALVGINRPVAALSRLRRGWAYRVRGWPNGAQTILEIYPPGSIVGLETMLLNRAIDEVIALTPVTTQRIDLEKAFPDLMARRSTALYLSWLLGEANRHKDRHVAALAHLDARERVCMMLYDAYELLRRREFVRGLSYNLPMTQQQMADYVGLTVVHVNRTLKRLREERIVLVDKHVVMIRDLEGLRKLAEGAGSVATAETPEHSP